MGQIRTQPGPLPVPSDDLGRALLGIWSLLSREDFDREGRRLIDPILGADPLGILCLAPGHFAAQFMNRRRSSAPDSAPASSGPAPTASAPAPPAANNSSALDGYDAYFGTYALDAGRGTITVRLEGALSPANIGQEFTREIRVVGDRLLIRLATTAADGTAITRTLTFARLR
jgi:hypothetical protein